MKPPGSDSVLFERSGPGWNYERLVVLNDRELGLRAIIAIDSTRRGPAFGGVRRLAYADEGAALDDVLALASAMTAKTALAGLAAGGAKTVILDREGLELEAVYGRVGAAIESLGGRYVCGPDLGTGDRELAWVRASTAHVNPAHNDAGASTARGVLAGVRAVWAHLGIDPGASTAVVEGCGAVGLAVVQSLLSEGVRVIAGDTSAAAIRSARDAGAEIVAPSRLHEQACDVFMPCAVGGTLTEALVARLRCRAVCGSANNQIASPQAALALQARRIVHAPDIVVSAGAVIEGVLTVHGDAAPGDAVVLGAIERIEATTTEVLERAAVLGQPPSVIAVALAHERIEG